MKTMKKVSARSAKRHYFDGKLVTMTEQVYSTERDALGVPVYDAIKTTVKDAATGLVLHYRWGSRFYAMKKAMQTMKKVSAGLDQMRQESHQCKNDDTEKLEQKLELRLCKGTHSEQLKQLGETMKCDQISYNRQFEQMGQKLQLCKDDQVEALTSMRCELEQCKKAVCDQVFHTFTEVAQGAPGDEGALAQQPAASRDLHHPSSMTPPSETHDGISTNAADMEIVFVETSGSDSAGNP